MGCGASAPQTTSSGSNSKVQNHSKGSPPKPTPAKLKNNSGGQPKPAALPLPPGTPPKNAETPKHSKSKSPTTSSEIGENGPPTNSAGKFPEAQDPAKSIEETPGTKGQTGHSGAQFSDVSKDSSTSAGWRGGGVSNGESSGDLLSPTATPTGTPTATPTGLGQSDVSTDASWTELQRAERAQTEPRGTARPELHKSGGSRNLADELAGNNPKPLHTLRASPGQNGVPLSSTDADLSGGTPKQTMPLSMKGTSTTNDSPNGPKTPNGPNNGAKSRIQVPPSPGRKTQPHHAPSHGAAPLPQVPANAAPASLTVFTMRDLKEATGSFSKHNLLGEGGFGCVYKGKLKARLLAGNEDDSSSSRRNQATVEVAVKLLNEGSLQGQKEWLAELQFLGGLHHEHLVTLLGYASEKKKLLLVYEFMPGGSVEELLFGTPQEFPWNRRMQVALGAAKGLAYLHDEERGKSIIYRDFKTSNILLDKDLNAKLSDFGLARMAPVDGRSHVTTRVVGTQGYADPSYVMTGKLTVKSDVYSFGVVLLELMSGRVSIDPDRPAGEKVLVEWATQFLQDRRQLFKMIDPALNNVYSIKAAQKCAQLALSCLSLTVQDRPSTSMLVKRLTAIVDLCEAPHFIH